MLLKYGKAPKIMGAYDLDVGEQMLYLYLPIHLPGEDFKIPERAKIFRPLIGAAIADCPVPWKKYFYLTCKTLWVQKGSPGNREGVHIDGWGSNGDLNYVWSDMNPTQFAVQKFKNISTDDKQSMIDMEAQLDESMIMTYPDRTLLRLNEEVVHRVNPNPEAGFRTFCKITVSDHQFRLKGNSHNHLLDYDWSLNDRGLDRNIDNGDGS